MSDHFRIFLGYDSRESAAFAVAAHSILQRASRPVSITPLIQPQLRRQGLYRRDKGATESTEFSLTRFLVPVLSNFEGFSLFLDCDVLVKCDVFDLLLYAMAQPGKAVYVVQHDYEPNDAPKFLGQGQTSYPRKNWSSVMLFANAKCTTLDAAYVNGATGLALHRFQWLQDDQIGSLPLDLNWLVGEYAPNPTARILHYTRGTPCFADYAGCDHADEWWTEYERLTAPARATEQALWAMRERAS